MNNYYKSSDFTSNKSKPSFFSRLFKRDNVDYYFTHEKSNKLDWTIIEDKPKYKVNINTYRFTSPKRNEITILLEDPWYQRTQTYILF